MSPTVETDTIVFLHYTLTGPDGAVLDSSAGGSPLAYLHGHGNIVPGLERQVSGRAVGDRFEAVVPAAEGYGERRFAPQAVPKAAFPPDAELAPGVQFFAQGPGGEPMPLWVARLEADQVWVTRDHPLAGVDLRFAIEVVEVRAATTEELAHGHPHLPGMHHH